MERQRSFLFFSCDKSQEIKFTPTDKDQAEFSNDLVQQLKDNVPFDQLRFNFSDNNEVLNSGTNLRGGGECNCTYRIVSATIGNPDANSTASGFEFNYLNSTLTTACSNGCFQYLQDYRGTDSGCYPLSCANSGNLTISPFQLFPFNCSVPRNSTGSFNFSFFQYFNNLCIAAPVNNPSTMTVQIFCSEKNADPNCRDGEGYGFASDLITVDVASGVGTGTVTLEIGGECGCSPIVL